jgi:hypothetical protein
MGRSHGVWPRMGQSIFRDMLRRAETAMTFHELRALRRFARIRLVDDERLAELDEAIERRAMAMIVEAEQAGRPSR